VASLAAIIEEGERRHAEATSLQGMSAYMRWLAEHGTRLLAVARAAVEVVDADESEGWCRTLDARLALRAAVRGEEEKKG